jgi:hypothetical protein
MTHPVRPQRPGSGRFICLLALAATAGCGHTEPFGSRRFDTDQPFDPTAPTQLTLNRGPDRRAAWLPDGSGILYSTQFLDRLDDDVCLALLPPTGGRQRALTCDLSSTGGSLTEALESAAPAADARLAFVAATSAIGALGPDTQGLVLATVQDPASRQMLLRFPYTIPGRRTHGGLSQLRWLSPSRLLYLGESVTTLRPCQFCEMDTLRSGLEAVVIDADGVASPQAIPGTDFASGVSPGTSEDEIFYTLGGDTRVYRQFLSSGAVTMVHDFGPAGIVRDVHVIGNQMAAVVGGRVNFGIHPSLGVPTQWDSGGILHLVNFQAGTVLTLDAPATPGFFRRPQLSPTGSEVVAELFPLIITPIRDPDGNIRMDTTVSRVGDLYLFGQP